MPHLVRTFRVLSIEDSQTESPAILRELERLNNKLVFKQVSTLFELQHQLQTESWNLIVSDYKISDFTAREALEHVRRYKQDIPFILLSHSIGEEVVADMMKAGVEDVVLKSRLERLIPVVKRILREHETRDKEAKAHKVANEAFAAKEQMLAIVSHDIKNPLSALQLEAQMLLRAANRAEKSVLAEEVKIQANRILKTTDRMKILISDLLDKNKSENGLANIVKTDIDATKLLQDVVDALRPLVQEKEIFVRTSVPEDSIVPMDRNKMFQVFSNLLNNAIKFTPARGSIEVSVEEDDNAFIFSVQDSGPGLDEKELNKVFEKYWTGSSSDSAGTGLGLFICKTIVEAHGGQIFVENVAGAGARFRFTIPKSQQLQKVCFSYLETRTDERKKIYIVDDDEDLREVISWALGKEGYSVHSFRSPQEALNCLTRGSHLPNLIVVDFHMDEMKGSEFVIKKNEIHAAKTCPVVMISASPQEVADEVPPELYKEVITKPIDLEGLVDNVRKFLD